MIELEILIWESVPLSLGEEVMSVTKFFISEMETALSVTAHSSFQNFLLSLRYGDYPKLPDRSQHERDPWYDWDHTDLRLNWGEPVRKAAHLTFFSSYVLLGSLPLA